MLLLPLMFSLLLTNMFYYVSRARGPEHVLTMFRLQGFRVCMRSPNRSEALRLAQLRVRT